MTVPIWPVSLPQSLRDMSHKVADNTIRSQNSIGVDKIRRKTTANKEEMSGVIRIDNNQRVILKNFFYETIKGGSLAFYFPSQYGETDLLVRLSPYETQRVGGIFFDVSIKLEILP